MNVRELISSLLDYDMNATVEILVESEEDSFDTNDFEIVENNFSSSSYLTLKVIQNSHVVVDKSDYNDFKNEKLELEGIRENLITTLGNLEQKIYELEENK